MLDQIWKLLTTFTEESQKVILEKCAEYGFDTKRGVVSLEESFVNLIYARNILLDAIDKKKLIQLPITVQKDILVILEDLSKSFSNLVSATDEVENIVDGIEKLNVHIWRYGLHNLSEEVLGYATKMNQLKNMELEILELRKSLNEALSKKNELLVLLTDAQANVETLKSHVAESETAKDQVLEDKKVSETYSQNASALLTTIQQSEQQSNQLLATTKTGNAEVKAIEGQIKEFYKQVDSYRKKIEDSASLAQVVIDENKGETEKLITNLQSLESSIKVQIEKATGFTLFHSFQKRQEKLAKSKNQWTITIFILVLISMSLTAYIIGSTVSFDYAFYLKLSLTLPIIYLLTFCTLQYSRERRLEEEYAFKSNISISLNPYKELIEKMIVDQPIEERQKFIDFMIDSVGKVFDSPTDKIFEIEQKKSDSVKQLESVLDAVIKPLEPILKLLKH